MRGRSFLAGVGVFASLSPALAQFPPPAPLPPTRPFTPPVQMPRPVAPAATPQPAASGPVAEAPLPYPENRVPFDAGAVSAKRTAGGWQVWVGPRPFKTLGDDEAGAQDVTRVLRDLRPTEWAAIGSPRPVVEYGLTNGRPAPATGLPRMVVPIDLRTVRVEPLKGVWCLRDDGNILFNFGRAKADADQALGVVRRYGFNRIGLVGNVAAPALTYFFVALDGDGAAPPAVNPLAAAAQEQALARTGIPVPGVGYVGEMVRIDPRKVDSRRDGADWVVAAGADVLARFGPDPGAARDAARVVREGNFTEFCTAGGVTFFLTDGRPPARVPLSAQGRRFDPGALKVAAYGARWAVTEQGRHLFDVASAAEGEAVVKLVKHFQFDQVCRVGTSPRAGLSFLAKSR